MTNWLVRFNTSTHSQKYDAIQLMNKTVAASAEQLGFEEINFVGYAGLDNNPDKRKNILDSILGPVQPNDLIVVQFPLWTNLNFQQEFIDRLRNIQNTKLIALIHDIPTWMFTEGLEEYDRENDFWLQQLRKFDALIVGNKKIAAKLKQDEVQVPMIAMHLWDYAYTGPVKDKQYIKKLYYVGGRDITGINYTGATPLHFYGKNVADEVVANPSVTWLGRVPSDEIASQMDGGFGLVVSDNITEKSNMNFVYYNQFNNPTKLSLYLAAGLPVIVSERTAHARWIKRAGIGLVIDDLNEVDRELAKVKPEDYQNMLVAVEPWQKAITSGFFVKRALMAAMRYVNLGFKDVLA